MNYKLVAYAQDFVSFLLQNVKDASKIDSITLYGSVARGEAGKDSDIDIFIEKLTIARFKGLWEELSKKFECINASDFKSAYEDYLLKGTAIRFSKSKSYIPNMEVKFPKNELDEWTIKNKRKVILNREMLFISPLAIKPYNT